MNRELLQRYAWLSIMAAVLTIALKSGAYFVSGSVGLLSDAMESGVNLVAAVVTLLALMVAARPPDEQHNYGHDKAEYFSSGVEGTLILIAALGIAYAAVERLLNPRPLEQVGLGLVISVIASVVNLVVARILLNAGKQHDSIALEADAHHLMTDVWTSVGVVLAVFAVVLTGWVWLDAFFALAVAANILWSGVKLLRRSMYGLMDSAFDTETLNQVTAILQTYETDGITWHGLRTRRSGARKFMSVHILVPGAWSVKRGHDLLEHIEADIRKLLPRIVIVTHLEPIEDPVSQEDISIYPGRE
ncbi:MAG: cation transporter [Anaerolineae bacterium]|nr:cation transporter [Anaerolineae bacterium]MCA9889240.1 cation transporter [Anaerolineae bacterium]MCA9893576.1 cation transporter [Anaerolineae bacterium]